MPLPDLQVPEVVPAPVLLIRSLAHPHIHFRFYRQLADEYPVHCFTQRAELPAHQPASCNAVPTVNDFPLHMNLSITILVILEDAGKPRSGGFCLSDALVYYLLGNDQIKK